MLNKPALCSAFSEPLNLFFDYIKFVNRYIIEKIFYSSTGAGKLISPSIEKKIKKGTLSARQDYLSGATGRAPGSRISSTSRNPIFARSTYNWLAKPW